MPGSLQQRRELGRLSEPVCRDLWELEGELEERDYHFFDYALTFENAEMDRESILRGMKELSKLLEYFKIDVETKPKRPTTMETE